MRSKHPAERQLGKRENETVLQPVSQVLFCLTEFDHTHERFDLSQLQCKKKPKNINLSVASLVA